MHRAAASILAFVLLLLGARGTKLQLRTKAGGDNCGKGFENLNEGSQKYFDTTAQLWHHPGRQEQFGTFEKELKCWYTYMLTTKCDGLESQAATRKAKLHETCMDV